MTNYWVIGGPGIPCGARRLTTEPLGPAPEGYVWLDVCIIGTHIPQMYLNSEIYRLLARDCERFGLCPDCFGRGDLANGSDTLDSLTRSVDQLIQPCPNCGGSGRPALRITVTRTDGSITGELRPLSHKYAPAPAGSVGLIQDTCLACGMPQDGTGPKGEVLHHGTSDDG